MTSRYNTRTFLVLHVQRGVVKLVLWRHWMHLSCMHPVTPENQFHSTKLYKHSLVEHSFSQINQTVWILRHLKTSLNWSCMWSSKRFVNLLSECCCSLCVDCRTPPVCDENWPIVSHLAWWNGSNPTGTDNWLIWTVEWHRSDIVNWTGVEFQVGDKGKTRGILGEKGKGRPTTGSPRRTHTDDEGRRRSRMFIPLR